MGHYFTSDQLAAVLNAPMRGNDAHASTVREYFYMLLETLWNEQDGFSGKRPFGNSSWDHDIYGALAEAGVIEATKDVWDPDDEEHGWQWEIADEQYLLADALILNALRSLMLRGAAL